MTLKELSNKKPMWIMAIVIVLSTTFACRLFPISIEPGFEERISYDEGIYIIEPESILKSLTQGDINIFLSPNTTLEPAFPVFAVPVQWSQADYLHIAQAFYRFVWREPMEEWNLHKMVFKMKCEDSDRGPQAASFELFETISIREGESRLVREIIVKPSENTIMWTESEFRPMLNRWHSIDQTYLNISSNDALRIAENNGGKEVRLEINNSCVISATLAPDGLFEGWQVTYFSLSQPEIHPLEIYINEHTGDYKIVYPNTK